MLTRLREGRADATNEARSEEATGRSTPGVAVEGAAIRVAALRRSFGALQAIEHVDLEAEPGEVLGVVGPSGCGKTTLLELIAGLQDPDGGSIAVGDRGDPEGRLSHCAYMPQRDLLLPWLSALDNAALPLRIAGASRLQSRLAASDHFQRVGLTGFEQTRPDQLSGGMRQRVAFVRTLLAGKPVLLLDEPFASLDAITRAEMQSWLGGILDPDRHTVVLVTHDVEEALYLSDRVVVLSARPATVADRIDSPAPRAADRAAAVTSPRFAETKQRALRSLAGSGP